ncbi:hypothetical protein [Luteimicrobium album]|uniref:hypothetical protein n=1 Tax=Luteimicrobium album TaxID=1054550 RepID=UPI0024E0E36B|nr:hypothetical protein [Luteimicrobium album]
MGHRDQVGHLVVAERDEAARLVEEARVDDRPAGVEDDDLARALPGWRRRPARQVRGVAAAGGELLRVLGPTVAGVLPDAAPPSSGSALVEPEPVAPPPADPCPDPEPGVAPPPRPGKFDDRSEAARS